MSKRSEPRSFVSDDEQLPQDILYWASLFRATPAEVEAALEQVEDHPEPEERPAPGLHKPAP